MIFFHTVKVRLSYIPDNLVISYHVSKEYFLCAYVVILNYIYIRDLKKNSVC